MTQVQNGAPSKTLSRDLVLKILGENGVQGMDQYLTEQMVRKFGLGGNDNLDSLKLALEKARSLAGVKGLAVYVDYQAANSWQVRSDYGDLTVRSFKPMDWNLCVWGEKTRAGRLPNCRLLPRENRTVKFMAIKQKVCGRGFSAQNGLKALVKNNLRPILAQEFACYCRVLGAVGHDIELVGLGSVVIRAADDGLYSIQHLAYGRQGLSVAREKDMFSGYTDRFFIGAVQED